MKSKLRKEINKIMEETLNELDFYNKNDSLMNLYVKFYKEFIRKIDFEFVSIISSESKVNDFFKPLIDQFKITKGD